MCLGDPVRSVVQLIRQNSLRGYRMAWEAFDLDRLDPGLRRLSKKTAGRPSRSPIRSRRHGSGSTLAICTSTLSSTQPAVASSLTLEGVVSASDLTQTARRKKRFTQIT